MKNIALISDIHYSKSLNIKTLSKIKNELIKIKPDYICIPGDFIDQSINIDDVFINFIKDLSLISPTIISLGNHDISYYYNKHQKYDENANFDKFKIKNVYILNNEQITINDITFTGYTIPFINGYQDNPKQFLKDLKKLEFKTSKYNILLVHSPLSILGNDEIYNNKFIKKQDLILCGHMHNGMILPIFDKIIEHRGLIGPSNMILPKYAKGTYNFNKTTLIISKGITKVGDHAPKIFKILNLLYPIEIEVIKINL